MIILGEWPEVRFPKVVCLMFGWAIVKTENQVCPQRSFPIHSLFQTGLTRRFRDTHKPEVILPSLTPLVFERFLA